MKNVAVAAGWLQFLGQLSAQLMAGGLPTSSAGWVAIGASAVAAIGIHAASNSGPDTSK